VIRVGLVDDHVVVRSGFKALIEAQPELSVVGEASDGRGALQLVLEQQPDVVLMDLVLHGESGIEITRELISARPTLRVLMVTACEDLVYVRQALESGAAGYVPKRAAAEELVRAIMAVAAGGTYLEPELATRCPPSSGSRRAPLPRSLLSGRETEVLRLVARGHSAKSIAAELQLSPRTLETYKARAMEKLMLRNRADIVRYAAQRGWLSDV
jgi:DNA-binding NarL/FixJ family response regulator